jgi:hypothetical protein
MTLAHTKQYRKPIADRNIDPNHGNKQFLYGSQFMAML